MRKLDGTATGNTSNLLDWLSQVCGVKARRISSAQRPGARNYEIENRRYDLDGMLEIVDRERRKRGLEPIRRKAA